MEDHHLLPRFHPLDRAAGELRGPEGAYTYYGYADVLYPHYPGYLMMDPIASSNSLWIWLTGSLKIFGAPPSTS